jgi:hypothetical protein
MKVKQLKEILEGLDDNTDIIVSRDEEGNGYAPLGGIDEGFVNKNEWGYHLDNYYSDEYGWEDNGFESKEEWQEFKKKAAKKVIVLYPN